MAKRPALPAPSRPVHKVKATECGRAQKGDALTPSWGLVTCETCLRTKPLPVRSSQRPSSCVEVSCSQAMGCHLCNRCGEHCLAKALGDALAHTTYWASRPVGPAPRRRGR